MKVANLIVMMPDDAQNIKLEEVARDDEVAIMLTLNAFDYGSHGTDGESVILNLEDFGRFILFCQSVLNKAKMGE